LRIGYVVLKEASDSTMTVQDNHLHMPKQVRVTCDTN
jgi:hypothetical protein